MHLKDFVAVWNDRLRPRLAYVVASVFIALAVGGSLSTACVRPHRAGSPAGGTALSGDLQHAASLRQVVPYVPPPASGMLEGVLAVGGALLALWATHLQRSLADLRNGKPAPAATASPAAAAEEAERSAGLDRLLTSCGWTTAGEYVHPPAGHGDAARRPLRRDEHVHHLDGNKPNNRPANLQLLSANEHCWRTHQRHPLVAECAWCQALFRPRTRHGRYQECCSRSCADFLRRRRWGAAIYRPRKEARGNGDAVPGVGRRQTPWATAGTGTVRSSIAQRRD